MWLVFALKFPIMVDEVAAKFVEDFVFVAVGL